MIPSTCTEVNFAIRRKPGSGLCSPAAKFYRPRNPEASPFHVLVCDYFDGLEQVYPERFQPRYGYWRPVIRTAVVKFLKCGILREGFARVRCPDCDKEYFVAFSCRSRKAGLSLLRSEAVAVVGYAAGGGGICAGCAPVVGIDHAEAVAHFFSKRPPFTGETLSTGV